MPGRRVTVRSSVRVDQERLALSEFCESERLHDRYEFAIRRSLDAWAGEMDASEVDRYIILGITQALRSASWLEPYVLANFDLPAGWEGNDQNWDTLREAIAVTLLEHYYSDVS